MFFFFSNSIIFHTKISCFKTFTTGKKIFQFFQFFKFEKLEFSQIIFSNSEIPSFSRRSTTRRVWCSASAPPPITYFSSSPPSFKSPPFFLWNRWLVSFYLFFLCLFFLFSEARLDEKGHVLDAGADLNDPEAFGEYCKDAIILTVITQVCGWKIVFLRDFWYFLKI